MRTISYPGFQPAAPTTAAWLTAALLSALAWQSAWAADVAVTIDAASVKQTMDGFGTSQRMFNDPHTFNNFDAGTKRAATVMTRAQEDQILDLLYTDLKLTRVRTAVDVPGFEPVNDNADANVADLSKFDFAWKGSDGYIDLVKRMMSRGLTTPFRHGMWERWMSESNPAELAENVLVTLLHWRDAGVNLEYYSLLNEPGYSVGSPEDPKRTASGAYMRDVIKILGPRMRAAGLTTKLVVSDDIGPTDAEARSRIILSDPGARPYVGALATHLYYGTDCSALQALGKQYGLPVWMTEFSSGAGALQSDWFGWAMLMHDQMWQYDISAIDYMLGFFGAWTNENDKLIALNTSGTTYTGYTLSREYYVTGQWSRFVPQGSTRIASSSGDPSIKATAFLANGTLAIVGVNSDASQSRSVRFTISGMPFVASMSAVRTSASESWASLPAITCDASGFTAVLPPRSITTFTSAAGPVTGNVPPTVQVTSPTSGSSYSAPASIQLTAAASDQDGTIASVEFFANGQSLGLHRFAPFSWTWANVPAGTYALTARATDDAGAVTTSAAVNVTVAGAPTANQPPIVAMTAPSDRANYTAPASVPLSVSASDPDGTVQQVEIFANGVSIGIHRVLPVVTSWTGVGPGTYVITARATDDQGATTTSAPVTITVHGTPPVAAAETTAAGADPGGAPSATCGMGSTLAFLTLLAFLVPGWKRRSAR
ncbi:MAG: hypothetical protein H0W83_02945 [Planctomycetes bacterium]|nr:hypothetical protein [Planctomycetota bacterium]